MKPIFLASLILLANCAVKVNTQYDHNAPFDQYQTFCWFENCEFTIDGPVYLKKDSATIQSFQSAIVNELERKGYVYDQNNPDFLLHMHIVVEEQEGVMSSPYIDGDQSGWEGAFPFEAWENQTYTYLKGSLLIDIADANESKMVWRSDAVEYLDITTDISETQLRKGVRKALKKFPPEN
jgi:hypothetical protein